MFNLFKKKSVLIETPEEVFETIMASVDVQALEIKETIRDFIKKSGDISTEFTIKNKVLATEVVYHGKIAMPMIYKDDGSLYILENKLKDKIDEIINDDSIGISCITVGTHKTFYDIEVKIYKKIDAYISLEQKFRNKIAENKLVHEGLLSAQKYLINSEYSNSIILNMPISGIEYNMLEMSCKYLQCVRGVMRGETVSDSLYVILEDELTKPIQEKSSDCKINAQISHDLDVISVTIRMIKLPPLDPLV